MILKLFIAITAFFKSYLGQSFSYADKSYFRSAWTQIFFDLIRVKCITHYEVMVIIYIS